MESSQERTRIEVRYAETDQMGIVHHSVYAVWFEQARTQFFRDRGADYAEMEKQGFACPVLELGVQYKSATHYGEFVEIETSAVQVDKLRFRLDYKLFVNNKLCTTGFTVHCLLKDGRPTRDMPESFVKLFE
ncbi:acyl-CoA thioester hydrolase [Fibrobacter sp. UWH9]|uniref:acyl-CoA thioesterase n=1 Tax=unclassified Fibrobacter TaxID=2634177 RepID=UPI0009121BB6|nr:MULTISPECIES: thioesterase family protein [Fibrobacter]MCQ2100928.1 acyl-CoA thioesterase [Fibrobacter sp.]MCL4102932.1 putative esterase [Fibrobacter succinogenes]MDO4947542.1 thioesterase family protein [Fibrobacter sp.]OWV04341.1 thioesterase [Fibrobacter sp. UWH3]OWV05189.1 thioesterase [Fibrobacter sp. UWH1]